MPLRHRAVAIRRRTSDATTHAWCLTPHSPIRRGLSLSAVRVQDIPQLVMHLRDPGIARQTLAIPFPYTARDARAFLDAVRRRRRRFKRPMDWAIRMPEGRLIGLISLQGTYGPWSHRDEIGYWLAKPYRGRGIMPRAVNAVVRVAFRQYGLIRLEMSIFRGNRVSARVAEKCGFRLEGVLRRMQIKDGRCIDAGLYARTRPPTPRNSEWCIWGTNRRAMLI